MNGKRFIQKLKTEFIGASLIGLSYFNSFAQENYIPKYNTTTSYIIKNIQKENSPIHLKTLDEIISQSKKIVKENYKGNPYDEENAKNLVKEIGNLINKKNPLLEEKNPCYKRCLVYLAVSEVNKLPIYPVLIPEHMFLRWDPDGIHKQKFYGDSIPEEKKNYLDFEWNPASNKGDFNWDPNFLESFDDAFYEYFFSPEIKFSYKEIKEGIYLKNLNKNELLSIAYNEESAYLFDKEDYMEVIKASNKSLELNKKNILGHYNKGESLYLVGKYSETNCEKYFEESFENFEKASEFISSWSSYKEKINIKKAWTLKQLGKFREAEELFNDCVNTEKKFLPERLAFYILTRQTEKAKKDYILSVNQEAKDFLIAEHNNQIIFVSPNELRGQLNNWHYAEEKCKKLNSLEGIFLAINKKINAPDEMFNVFDSTASWRLPSIEELASISNTQYAIKNEPSLGYALWSSTKDSLSEKKILVRSKTDKIYKVNKNLDYYVDNFKQAPINSVCVKTINKNEWDIDKELSELKEIILKNPNY